MTVQQTVGGKWKPTKRSLAATLEICIRLLAFKSFRDAVDMSPRLSMVLERASEGKKACPRLCDIGPQGDTMRAEFGAHVEKGTTVYGDEFCQWGTAGIRE